MTTENNQLGGGYAYQWRCASLLALCYLLPHVRPARPELHNLVMTFLGHVEDMYLEGVSENIAVFVSTFFPPDPENGTPPASFELKVGLEDITLRGRGRLLLLQVKTKEAEGTHWTPADSLFIKALYRFYENPALDHVDPPVCFVFLSNRGFNPDLMRLKRAIDKGSAVGTSLADTLFRYLEEYAAGSGKRKRGQRTPLDRARFDGMLARLALIEFLPLDVLPLTLRDVAEAHGLDGEDTYRRLYTGVSERSIRQGGARVTPDELYRIVPTLFAGRLVDYIRSQPERAAANYLLSAADAQPLPPLGITAAGLITKIDRLVGGNDPTLLSTAEAFVLLAAACLPHLLQQFAGVLQTGEGSPTHQLAAVFKQEPASPSGSEQTLREFATAIETVREARTSFVPEDPAFGDLLIRGEHVRLRVLGALLRLATLIHLDQHVDSTPPPSLAQGDWSSHRAWWHQAYVQSVTIENRCIQLSIALPIDHYEQYHPWLVDKLDRELEQHIRRYSDAILAHERLRLDYRPAIVRRGPVSPMPDHDWQRLRHELRTEQARATADEHDQRILETQQLRDLLVYDRARQAEQYIREEQFAEAASLYAEVAQRLGRAGAYMQARLYARRAAGAYAQVPDRQAEADQHLFAAEVWLQNTLSPHVAQEDLTAAEKLSTGLDIPELRIRLLLAQALLDFSTLRDQKATPAFQEARSLLPRVHDRTRRFALAHMLTVREALFAMVREEWGRVRTMLVEELGAVEQRPVAEQIETLGLLLLVAAETGDWELADQIYDQWSQRRPQGHPEHDGVLAMHYAASLARRNELQSASETYDQAIAWLDSNAPLTHVALAYENKQYMLGRHGPLISSTLFQDEPRRIDLFNSQTQGETRGYSHEGQALRAFAAGDMERVARHVRLAKLFYWRNGDWMGLEHIYCLQARQHEQQGDGPAALLEAVRGCDRDLAERLGQTLRDTGTPTALQQIVEALLKARPAMAEKVVAIRALGVLADAIPPTTFTRVVEYLITLLRGPEITLQHLHARSYAAEGLRQLIPQMNQAQVNEATRLVLDQLMRDQGWEVTKELIRLITATLTDTQVQIGEELLAPILNKALALGNEDIFRSVVDNLVFALIPRLPQQLRALAATYLQNHPNHLDSTGIRVLLGDTLLEKEIVSAIEQILVAISPPPVDSEEVSVFRISFGGTRARQLINYNTILPASLHQPVVDSLMNAILSGRGELMAQADAIRTIWNLPEAAIWNRADEIIVGLIQVESGQIHRTGFSLGLGSVEDVRQASLQALGQLYRFAEHERRAQILQRLVVCAHDPSSEVRLGTIMACKVLDGKIPQALLLAVFVLLHDSEPAVVARACIAASHFIAYGGTNALLPSYIDRLIRLARESGIVEVRQGAAQGLSKIAADDQLDEEAGLRVTEALTALENDTSARVRRTVGATLST